MSASSAAAPLRLVPQPEALNSFPNQLAQLHRLLPLRFFGSSLVCASQDQFDLDVLSQVQFQLQRALIVVKVPENLFCEAFERQYGSRLYPQATALLDSLCTSHPTARDREVRAEMDWAPTPMHITTLIGASGGVGTSSIAASLATAIAQAGRKVGLLDANFSAPSAHVALGSRPDRTLRDLQRGFVHASDVISVGAAGVGVVIGEPGWANPLSWGDLANLHTRPSDRSGFHNWLVDVPAGQFALAGEAASQSHRVIVVTNGTPAGLHQALITGRSLADQNPRLQVGFMFNRIRTQREAFQAFSAIRSFSPGAPFAFAGWLPECSSLAEAWRSRVPLPLLKPNDEWVKMLRSSFASLIRPAVLESIPQADGVHHQAV